MQLQLRLDDASMESPCDDGEDSEITDEEEVLERFCADTPICAGSVPLQWQIECTHDHEHENGECFAVIQVCLHGVPHKLAGAPQETEKEARLDAARRALWYLQCPGYEADFEAESLVSATARPEKITAPPGDWLHDDESSQEAIAEADRKTAIMRTQNRLQQTFSQQLQGVGVWEWTYETADVTDDTEWPPLFRATVQVPVLGKEFKGDWIRGQRESQIQAIACVNAFLDEVATEKPQ